MQKLRRKLTLLGAVMALFLLGSVVFAAWLVTGNGNGAAQATSAANLVVTPGTTTADLYPGATGAVKVNVNNPNAFAVTITSIAANGAVTTAAPGCTTTGVTFTAPTTTGQVIAAGATANLTLAGAAAMSNASLNACQGATFNVPVTVSASSN
jgi:hypothetical protein